MDEIEWAVVLCLTGPQPVVLAVSGGVDSMVLLTAAARRLDRGRLCVATFDHGTGAAAADAVRLVLARCKELGVEAVAGRGALDGARSEAAWRDARWEFLRREAARRGAFLATAHTLDDQIETVFMRLLRGAGTRGLAGLYASSSVRRPLLAHRRPELLAYARAYGVIWADDPTNVSVRFFRNRVRHEILPALRRVEPDIDRVLTSIGRSAGAWRGEAEAVVSARLTLPANPNVPQYMDVPAATLAGYDRESLCIVWPVLLERLGIIADRRGLARLAEFTLTGRAGSRIQVSGHWEIMRSQLLFQVRRLRRAG